MNLLQTDPGTMREYAKTAGAEFVMRADRVQRNLQAVVEASGLENLPDACAGLVAFHRANDPCRAIEAAMAKTQAGEINPGMMSRLQFYKGLAIMANGSPEISLSQAMAVANYGPQDFGTYNNERVTADNVFDAMYMTLLEDDPEYCSAYARMIKRGYRAFAEVQPFTAEDPFNVIIIGDHNLRMARAVDQALGNDHLTRGKARLIVGDNAEIVAHKMQQGKLPTRFEQCDARNLEPFLQQFAGQRGVIVAGEELIDDLPVEVYCEDFGRICVPYYDLSGDPVLKLMPIADSPYHAKLWELWTKAFPEYAEYIHNESYLTDGRRKLLTISPGQIALTAAIAGSGFNGWWMGGDYTTYFLDKRGKIKAIEVAPLRVINNQAFALNDPLVEPALDEVFRHRVNMTADVDFGLLRLGVAMGMSFDFLGVPAHFKQKANNKPLADIAFYVEQTRRTVPELHRQQPSKRKLEEIFARHRKLDQQLSGVRVNWIMNIGNTPGMFAR